jgi:hypothetical protein
MIVKCTGAVTDYVQGCMQMALTYRSLFVVTIAIVAGCNDASTPTTKTTPANTTSTVGTSATNGTVDSWLGKWIGPEGTSLNLTKSEDVYRVTIQSLDGPAQYEAKAVGDHIEFLRNGKTESIRATDGKGTGMKWLQDKTNCLVIQLSEGFCRD